MTTITIDGILVDFPYEPYQCQVIYMRQVIACLLMKCNGVLESPTGTGKTLCLLCAVLGWLRHKKNNAKTAVTSNSVNIDAAVASSSCNIQTLIDFEPRVYYTSRTHSQLSQIVKELNKTSYIKDMNICILGSRDQLCINEFVLKNGKTTQAKNQICREMVAKRTCRYYNTSEIARQGRVKKMDATFDENNMPNTVPDIEDLVIMGKFKKSCPYYDARASMEKSDIVLLPYNYILDPVVRKANKLQLANGIIIFDEAHNIPKFCEEAASSSLRARDVAVAAKDAQMILKLNSENVNSVRTIHDKSNLPFGQAGEDDLKTLMNEDDEKQLAHLVVMLAELDGKLADLKSKLYVMGRQIGKLPGKVVDARYLFQMLKECGIEPSHCKPICDLIDKCVNYIAENAHQLGSISSKGASMKRFSEFLSIVYAHGDRFEDDIKHFNFYIVEDDIKAKDVDTNDQLVVTAKNKELILNYWCLCPAIGLRFLQNHADHKAHSVIFTSGTLMPMNRFIEEIGLPVMVSLSNKHVIDANKQLSVSVLSQGPNGFELRNTFEHRESARLQVSIGSTLVNFARITPQGMLVFFASYSQMNSFIRSWRQSGLFDKIARFKNVLIESHSKAEFATSMKEYDHFIKTDSRGALLMAICRGKVSEGIDFADSHARLVMLVGIPYPPLMDARVALKRDYLDCISKMNKHCLLSGNEWYSLEAVRATNQAIGRVIRHKDDFGAVVLADTRFYHWNQEKKLPSWILSNDEQHKYNCRRPIFCEVYNTLLEFFKEHKTEVQPVAARIDNETVVNPGQCGAFNLCQLQATKPSSIVAPDVNATSKKDNFATQMQQQPTSSTTSWQPSNWLVDQCRHLEQSVGKAESKLKPIAHRPKKRSLEPIDKNNILSNLFNSEDNNERITKLITSSSNHCNEREFNFKVDLSSAPQPSRKRLKLKPNQPSLRTSKDNNLLSVKSRTDPLNHKSENQISIKQIFKQVIDKTLEGTYQTKVVEQPQELSVPTENTSALKSNSTEGSDKLKRCAELVRNTLSSADALAFKMAVNLYRKENQLTELAALIQKLKNQNHTELIQILFSLVKKDQRETLMKML